MTQFGYTTGGRRKPFNARWIIALIIAVIAIVSYYSRTEVNPVTGEKQRVAMSPEQEVALGLQAAPEMKAQMGGSIEPPDPQALLIDEVGQKLVRQIPEGSPWKFEFHLLADPKTINAFALPGGQVFITKALLDQLQTEAQLAGVLGHEVGHVIERHGAEHMATGQLGQMLTVAVGVGASGEDGAARNASVIAAMVNGMIQLKYGREDELESDAYGLNYMVGAGFNPGAMVEVMNILEKAGGGGNQPEFMQTHPHPESRRQEIDAFLKKQFPRGIPPELTEGRILAQVEQ
jgi:predicted Zn-dependent protease